MRYFTTATISLGFLSALSGALFIYLWHLGIHWAWVQALLGLLTLTLWLTLPRPALAWSGFFTGILWFWWIAMSFRYYDLTWMIPLVILAVGLVYGLLFWAVGWLPHLFLRALALGVAEFIHPFGFDWFRPALMFTGSILGDRLWHYWLILTALSLFLFIKKPWRWSVFALLIPIYHSPMTNDRLPMAGEIQLVQTHIEQAKKWDPRYRDAIVDLNLQSIEIAIRNGKKAVILPESAFPLYLNTDIPLVKKLLRMSRHITIVTGALFTDGKHPYNSTYLFKAGRLRVMHKVVLVPFGEEVPLPRWMGRWVNDLFFGGASDYFTARKPSDFTMLGRTWRNAICYEATSDILFAGNPRTMAAISNNAWFAPSTEATLQHLLMQLQADRHGTVIFHATNGPGTGIIIPR
ncbi:apolipoprotein N-acyltransferase [Hydrogenimonas sp. SS33]|uniref:apolipoprotein N-acyltransferase n=1 Tax=Hydrogenimonas leucolamina TaxID=2954236 RepID=UPI00336BB811